MTQKNSWARQATSNHFACFSNQQSWAFWFENFGEKRLNIKREQDRWQLVLILNYMTHKKNNSTMLEKRMVCLGDLIYTG
jgi:hypothetical protein